MSRDLIESIIDGDHIRSRSILEEKLNLIREKKMYEVKRMVATEISEASFGRMNVADKRAQGYVPAHEKLGLSPYDKTQVKVKADAAERIGKMKSRKTAPKTDTKSEPKIQNIPKSEPKSSDGPKKPGVIKRNLNTLVGREHDYTAPDTKGTGRAGRFVRKAWSKWEDVLRAGSQGNL